MKWSYEYGPIDRFLHWFIALAIIATLIIPYGMSTIPDEQKVIEYGDHGITVTTILILMIGRVLWRMWKGFPSYPGSLAEWQKIAAKLAHYSLYILIFIQLVTGILLASTTKVEFIANVYKINYTSFDLIPDRFYDTALLAHIVGYWALLGLIVLHIVAALKHHFIDKDSVLISMLPLSRRS